MNKITDITELVKSIQDIIIGRGTGEISSKDEYYAKEFSSLRKQLLQTSHRKKKYFPKDLIEVQTLEMFWDFKLSKFLTYKERREYVYKLFSDFIIELELFENFPPDQIISNQMKNFDSTSVHDIWEKALLRRKEDPDGAITLARTLLELVCKRILDEFGESYSNKSDLPKLYKLTSNKLNLSPNNHSEQIFKQLLGNCQSIVNNLSAVRNKHSDAHGNTNDGYKPSPRHAALAVNLAGAMATFLVTTWEENYKQ